MQIEDYLYVKSFHLPLLGTKPERMLDYDLGLLNRQVLGVIWLTLSKNVAHNMAKEKSTMGLMKVLSDMYEKLFANNKVFLMKKLFHLKIEEDFSVATLLNEFNMIVNQLSSVEINFNDEAHTLILLTSPPNSWEPKRATVNNSIDSAKLKFNDVKDQILIDKVRRIDLGKASTSSSALNIKSKG
uniref:Retrovirus-related Pol polyprotein from transposon TNT 1-94 n=1 Tax=Vitis vinifera TaxID=29760 RepID=A5BCL0_VITVI|nr:hypothetical protein VITISV_010114 [Vitis vinifera]